MNDASDDNRYAPPRAGLADPAAPDDTGGRSYGGRWRRFFAGMIDALFNCAIIFPVMFASIGFDGYVAAIVRVTQGGSKWDMYAALFRASAPGYVVLILIQGSLLYLFGQSVGKKLLGLRIVRMDGSRVGFPRLFFVRSGSAAVVGFIPSVGGLLALVDAGMIFRDSHQALHDQIADTVVVTAGSSPAATLAGARAARLAA